MLTGMATAINIESPGLVDGLFPKRLRTQCLDRHADVAAFFSKKLVAASRVLIRRIAVEVFLTRFIRRSMPLINLDVTASDCSTSRSASTNGPHGTEIE